MIDYELNLAVISLLMQKIKNLLENHLPFIVKPSFDFWIICIIYFESFKSNIIVDFSRIYKSNKNLV